jgi:hypothetical protein
MMKLPIYLALATALTVAQAQAERLSPEQFCDAMGSFAGFLAAFRDQGLPPDAAIDQVLSNFSNDPREIPNRILAQEIAKTVYALPYPSEDKATSLVEAHCLTRLNHLHDIESR